MFRIAGVVPSMAAAPGVLKLSILVLGDEVMPVWLRFWTIGVPARVLLPLEPEVGWFTGVLPATCLVAVGDAGLRCEGEAAAPAARFEAWGGVDVAISPAMLLAQGRLVK